MKRILLTAVLLLSPLSWASAQGTPAQRIQAARQRATQTGIPVSLLDTKVAEGRAKSIPEDRIATAVEQRLASLGRARTAMSSGPRRLTLTAADLNVGADALEAGVSPAVIGQLAQSASPDRRAVAIAVLSELVQQGMSSEQALARVTAALTGGADALRQLPGEARANGNGNANGVSRGNGNGNGNANGSSRANGNSARRGPPEGRGRDNAAAHGGRAGAGGGPPSSVPGPRGKGHGHGNGNGNGNGKGKP